MLYTVSATTKTPEEFYESIDMVYQDLENGGFRSQKTYDLGIRFDLRVATLHGQLQFL